MSLKIPRYFYLALAACMCFIVSVQSQNLKRKAGFNLNWKFYQGTPTGAPSAITYNDGSWQSVNVPHSASYDAPNFTAETNFYQGNCWYRKTFSVPASAKKVFMEFEGAMQSATVYVNGVQVAVHDNSGYTPFYCDISNQVLQGASNVVAVMLNNQKSADIPPGGIGSGPDFYLYSGLYRSVWLHFKDSVYIPVYSQQIFTENVSASSAKLHAKTVVKNDAASAKSVVVTVTLLDATNAAVASQSSTLSIPPKTLDTFDITTSPIANPHLWSPASPYMYSVKTVVTIAGAAVDSVTEPCGIRWFTWNPSQGFYLNGSRLEIRGMCVHQFEGWVENAVPDSRYFQEIKQLKNMGCNSVRCSHYPRAQAFYDACDKLGMLLYVEQPSWGWGATPNAACWTRMDSCVKEMVLSGRNHPSIYIWGLYNEPVPNPYVSFAPQITTLNKMAKSLDTTRFTAEANINAGAYGAPNGWNPSTEVPDIVGLNYSTSYMNAAKPWLNTESSDNFYRPEVRGSQVDLDTGDTSYYQREWKCMNFTLATSGQLAGGHFWCFKDYNSGANTNGNEGVVDRLTLPKTVFYKFRKMWTGQAMDFPTGGTPVKIELISDTNSLNATGADVFLLTATMRDAAGNQIATATGNVTFSVSPAASGTIFGGATVSALAGRAGAVLRTTTIPAVMTVTATYAGLPPATISLTTVPVSESYFDGPVGVITPITVKASSAQNGLQVVSTSRGYVFHCPPQPGRLSVIDIRGKTVYSIYTSKTQRYVISRKIIGAGIYYGVWESGAQRFMARLNAIE